MIPLFDDYSLKIFKFEDVPSIFKIIDSQREYMREWLPFVDATHQVEDTQRAFKSFATIENPQFGILYKQEIIGLIGFKETCDVAKKTEIGYWLSQNYQGKGVMTNAVIKLLEYTFDVMGMNRVTIKVAIKNIKSRRVPEKLGFVQEGIERDGELLVDNVYTDIVIYSILKKEYLEKIANGEIKIS